MVIISNKGLIITVIIRNNDVIMISKYLIMT